MLTQVKGRESSLSLPLNDCAGAQLSSSSPRRNRSGTVTPGWDGSSAVTPGRHWAGAIAPGRNWAGSITPRGYGAGSVAQRCDSCEGGGVRRKELDSQGRKYCNQQKPDSCFHLFSRWPDLENSGPAGGKVNKRWFRIGAGS
jgi:hypothetical protein